MGKILEDAKKLKAYRNADLEKKQNEVIIEIAEGLDPDSPEPLLGGTKLHRPVVSIGTNDYEFGDEIIKQVFWSGNDGMFFGNNKLYETLFDSDDEKLYNWFENMFKSKSLSENPFMIVPLLKITFGNQTKVCNLNLAGIRLYQKNTDKGVILQYTGFLNEQKITFTNNVRIISPNRPESSKHWETWELTIVKTAVGSAIVGNNVFAFGNTDLLVPDLKQTIVLWNKLQELNNVQLFNGLTYSDKWNAWFTLNGGGGTGDQRFRCIFNFPTLDALPAITGFAPTFYGHTHKLVFDFYLNSGSFTKVDVYNIVDGEIQQTNTYELEDVEQAQCLSLSSVWTANVSRQMGGEGFTETSDGIFQHL